MQAHWTLIIAIFLVVMRSARADCTAGMSSCNLCTTLSDCGWCTLTSTCETGNDTNSFGSCPPSSWVWLGQLYCPATPAPSVNCTISDPSCDSCTRNGLCGWCSSNRECQLSVAMAAQVATAALRIGIASASAKVESTVPCYPHAGDALITIPVGGALSSRAVSAKHCSIMDRQLVPRQTSANFLGSALFRIVQHGQHAVRASLVPRAGGACRAVSACSRAPMGIVTATASTHQIGMSGNVQAVAHSRHADDAPPFLFVDGVRSSLAVSVKMLVL
jgi:hypothetical protein